MGGGKERLFEAGRVLYFNFVMRLALTLVRGTALGYREGQGWAGLGDGAPGAGTARGSDAPIAQGSTAGALSGFPPAVGTGSAAIDDQGIPKRAESRSAAAATRREGSMYRQRISRALDLAWAIGGSERIKVSRRSSMFPFRRGERGRSKVLKGRLEKRGRALQWDIKHKTTSYSPRSRGREKRRWMGNTS